MGLSKQAKTLSKANTDLVLAYLATTRERTRNTLIFLLSTKAGLRAKEIALLKWAMVLTPDGQIADAIALENRASKGKSGRVIPMCKSLSLTFEEHMQGTLQGRSSDFLEGRAVISTARSVETSPQVIVNLFSAWYAAAGLKGCSSHSGRRTFITNAARKISTVGGSLRDVQALAGHTSLQTTQRYIEVSSEARRKVVDLV